MKRHGPTSGPQQHVAVTSRRLLEAGSPLLPVPAWQGIDALAGVCLGRAIRLTKEAPSAPFITCISVAGIGLCASQKSPQRVGGWTVRGRSVLDVAVPVGGHLTELALPPTPPGRPLAVAPSTTAGYEVMDCVSCHCTCSCRRCYLRLSVTIAMATPLSTSSTYRVLRWTTLFVLSASPFQKVALTLGTSCQISPSFNVESLMSCQAIGLLISDDAASLPPFHFPRSSQLEPPWLTTSY